MSTTIDINDLTLEEVEFIETEGGAPVDVLFGPTGGKARALRLAAWAIGRRDNPEMTYADTGKLKMMDMTMGESPAAVEG